MRNEGRPQGLNMKQNRSAPADGDGPIDDAIGTLAGARGMVKTQTAYQTAITVQKPRDLKKVEADILFEASQMGEDFIYSWQVNDKNNKETGKSTVEGVSIDGAMILVRNWGNAVCEPDLVDETPTHYLLKATFIDLEKGFSSPRLYRQRKGERRGGMDAERAEDIAFQIGQSKAIRNAVCRGIPQWMQDRAVEAAKSEAAKKYSDVPKAVEAVRKYAEGLKVSDVQLIARMGKPFDAWLPYDIVTIRSIFASIAKKQSSVREEFPPIETPTETKPEPETITTTGETVPEKKEPAPPAAGDAPPPAQEGTPAQAAPPADPTPPAAAQAAASPPPFQPPPGAVKAEPEPPAGAESPAPQPTCKACDKPIAGTVTTLTEEGYAGTYHDDCAGFLIQSKQNEKAAEKPKGKKT